MYNYFFAKKEKNGFKPFFFYFFLKAVFCIYTDVFALKLFAVILHRQKGLFHELYGTFGSF